MIRCDRQPSSLATWYFILKVALAQKSDQSILHMKSDRAHHLRSNRELQVVSHLERHVFQEVSGAVVSLVLIATASVNPEANL